MRKLLFAGLFVLSLVPNSYLMAQDFGRTTTNGSWSDGSWITDTGFLFASPDESDNVFIGDATAITGATEPATVNLNSIESIRSLELGNTAAGNLNILAGGELDVAIDVFVRNGLLDLQTGGKLTIGNNLRSVGPNASVLLNGGELIANSVQAEMGGNVDINSAFSLAGGISAVSGGTVSINAATDAGGSVALGGSTLNINANTTYTGNNSGIFAIESTVNINANVTAQSVELQGGTFSLTAGVLTADRLRLFADANGVAPVFQRTGGAIDVDRLSIFSNLTFDLAANDTIDGLDLTEGALFNAGRALNLSGNVSIGVNSTLNLAGNLTANSLTFSSPSAVLNRSPGDTFNVQELSLDSGASYVFTGNDDVISSSVSASGGNFTANAFIDLATLQVANGGVVTLNAESNIGSLLAFGDVLNLNAPSNISSATILVSQINVEQRLGDTEGLSIDSSLFLFDSQIDIQFDANSLVAPLDWGLRLTGDQQTALQGFLDDGSVTFGGGGNNFIGVIYDPTQFGNFTYLGYTSTVPEPSSLMIIGSCLALTLLRRTRSRS